MVLKNLMSFLNIAFLFKAISVHDLEFKDDEIEYIDGIDFENNKVMIKKKIFSNTSTTIQVEDDKRSNIYIMWQNYMQDIKPNFL